MATGKQLFVAQSMRDRLPRYRPGQQLPGVAELCQEFGVSTATAVGAMGALISEGLVESRKGASGGYFRSGRRRHDRAAALRAMTAQLEEVTEITQAVADQLQESTDLIREASEPVGLHEQVEDAVAQAMAGYTIEAAELPSTAWYDDTIVSISIVEVTGIQFSVLDPAIHAVVRAEADVPSRDAADEDTVGLDLDTNAYVPVERYLTVIISSSQLHLVGGRIDLGDIQKVDFLGEDN
ncbi:GntR family transcriptional regulator [Dietzia cercidiphylli]|uniref:GntR family transcriptional regulator n=1 Tax=Dietzia cercidiphylli TaxID=498199 RepID=UPI00223AEEF2|nr:GntR family transcriptional regulator [Dietzia cercidiphylli]MCT1515289.1 GntR family transcriptional regulator [Dietzia cercidiphylli]